MAENLDGKTALVTGGGSGIGRAASLAYAHRNRSLKFIDARWPH